jgi:hypothetical protein
MLEQRLAVRTALLGETQPLGAFEAYHDMFLSIATLVLLTALPTLWLCSPARARSKR